MGFVAVITLIALITTFVAFVASTTEPSFGSIMGTRIVVAATVE